MVVEEELSALMSSKNKGRKIKDDSIDKEKELQEIISRRS